MGPSHLRKLKKAQVLGTPIERGFLATRVIQALFNVGFLDELAKGNGVFLQDFAQQNHLDLRILRLLADYLYALGFLEREQDRYSLGGKGKTLVETLRGTFDILYAYEDLFHNLEAMLKKEKAYGREVKRRPEFVGKGSGQSAKLLPFPMAADLVKRNGFVKVLDLGCGDGEFLISLCRGGQAFRGYGVDLSPEVVALTERRLLQEGLEDRVKVMVGDIFNLQSIRDQMGLPDAATLFYVLHEFFWGGRQTVLDLLRDFRKVFPGVPLIVCEITQLQPEDFRKRPTIILEHHLFHDLSQQGSIPREEWKRIFSESGLRLVEELRLDFSEMSIFHLQ